MDRPTIEDLRNSSSAFLTPTDVCGVLECDPHAIRILARSQPERLGFPVVLIGNRTKIPRIPFLRFLGVE